MCNCTSSGAFEGYTMGGPIAEIIMVAARGSRAVLSVRKFIGLLRVERQAKDFIQKPGAARGERWQDPQPRVSFWSFNQGETRRSAHRS